jgi:Phosphodiester glycosidase
LTIGHLDEADGRHGGTTLLSRVASECTTLSESARAASLAAHRTHRRDAAKQRLRSRRRRRRRLIVLAGALVVALIVLAGALVMADGRAPAVPSDAHGQLGGRHGVVASRWPPRIKPVFPHPLPGEGVWRQTGPLVDGRRAVLAATFRPQLDNPSIVAYVAWFDHTRTALAYYPGASEPPGAAVRGPMMVPQDQRWRLLATFNSGFVYKQGLNGSTDNGRVNEPLHDGNATLLQYKNGRVAIVKWSGGPNAGPNVACSRQSLAPIVWNGRLNPALNTDPNSYQWGYTLGHVGLVWRTGIGIDRRGNLIFAVADSQTVISLAQILQHAGAIRAMELDINPEWHTLITYTHQHRQLVRTMVEPQPMQSATRYLTPDNRDFFAVYRRVPGLVTVPFK